MLLNVSVVLHRTWQTHELQLLNNHYHGEKIDAANTRLTTAILTACVALSRDELFCPRRARLETLRAEVAFLRHISKDGSDVASGFPLMAGLAEHITKGALPHNVHISGASHSTHNTKPSRSRRLHCICFVRPRLSHLNKCGALRTKSATTNNVGSSNNTLKQRVATPPRLKA